MTRGRIFLIVSVLLVFMYAAVTGAVAWHLTRRPHPVYAEPAPGDLEDVRIGTSDGQTLGGWLTTGQPGKCIVLLLHGNGGSRSSSMVRFEHLSNRGVGVLAISARAHGDSTGDTLDMAGGRFDVMASVAFLESRFPGRSIKVMGTSLGAGAALMAAPDLGDRVRSYLLETPYKDLATAVHNRLRLALPLGLDEIAYGGLALWSEVLMPGGLSAVDPWARAAAVPHDVPVVIIVGGSDERAQPWEARSILAQVPGHGTLVVIDGAHHDDCMTVNPSLYWSTIDDWLR